MAVVRASPELARPPTFPNRPTSGPTPSRGGRPPNLLVVALDCARAKSFPFGGYDASASTPVISELARRGTCFPNAVAPSNWTLPSHMSMFTGLYPNVHGLRTFRKGPAPAATVAERLKGWGYDTGLFTEMVHLVSGYGLESGFDHRCAGRPPLKTDERTLANKLASHAGFLYSDGVRRMIERVPPLITAMNAFNHPQEQAYKHEVCGEYIVDQFGEWVSTRSPDRPFFAFVNLVDAHEPYSIGESEGGLGWLDRWYARTPRYYLLAVPGLQSRVPWSELVAGYHRTIEAADRKVGRLLAALEATGQRDRTMVVVTADHGQSFGEDGNVFHGCGATDSIARVPLVVSPPSEVSVPRRVDRWTSLVELPGWLEAAATTGRPYDEAGRAVGGATASFGTGEFVYCEGAPASDPNRSLVGIGVDQRWNHRLVAAYRGREKFVLDLETGQILHWPTARDPDRLTPETLEGRDAADMRGQVFAGYEGATPIVPVPTSTHVPMEHEIDERLKSWGYD